jgi:hypothetical protein
MSFCLEREGGACASRVRFYRILPSPETPLARIVPDTIAQHPLNLHIPLGAALPMTKGHVAPEVEHT